MGDALRLSGGSALGARTRTAMAEHTNEFLAGFNPTAARRSSHHQRTKTNGAADIA